MHLLLLVNPFSGKQNGLTVAKWVQKEMENEGWVVQIEISQSRGYFIDYLSNVPLKSFDYLGVVGGDGTMHEVLNGLMRRVLFPEIPVILFPCGTGNAFNHDINSLDLPTSVQHLKQGNTKTIDIFCVEFDDKIAERLYAFNILGYGLVANINTESERLRRLGKARYTLAALIHIFQNPPFRAKITIDNQVWTGDFCFVLASNTIYTGNAMKMSPEAILDDGLLDFTVVPHTTFWHLLKLFPLIFSGKHITSPLLTYIKGKRLSIEALPSALIIDGESKGFCPLHLEVIPQKLKMIV